MSLPNISFLIIILFLLYYFFLINFNNNIQSLIFSEFFWITLYAASLLMSFLLNDFNLLSLTIFFLIFSTVEISTGLVFFFFQKFILNTVSTNNSKFNYNLNNIYFNRMLNLKKFKI